MRTFATGATSNDDTDKLDFEGFLSPLLLHEFAKYMHRNRHLDDGTLRASDNWQAGIPQSEHIKSAWRHFFDWWDLHRANNGRYSRAALIEALCGVIFRAMGYLHEELKVKE